MIDSIAALLYDSAGDSDEARTQPLRTMKTAMLSSSITGCSGCRVTGASAASPAVSSGAKGGSPSPSSSFNNGSFHGSGSRFRSAFGTGESPKHNDRKRGIGGGGGARGVVEGVSKSISRSQAVLESRRVSPHSAGVVGRKSSMSSISESSLNSSDVDGGFGDIDAIASSSAQCSSLVHSDLSSSLQSRRRKNGMDLGRLRFDTLPLFGREDEITKLREVYRRCRSAPPSEVQEREEAVPPGALTTVGSTATIGTASLDGSTSNQKAEVEAEAAEVGAVPALEASSTEIAKSQHLIPAASEACGNDTKAQSAESEVPPNLTSVTPPPRELILVAGPSGSGTSSLVDTALSRKYVERTCGLRAWGKFDLCRQQIPYAGISRALGELCREIQLLEKDPCIISGKRSLQHIVPAVAHDGPASFQQMRATIQTSLGGADEDELDLLFRLVPDLRGILEGGTQCCSRRSSADLLSSYGDYVYAKAQTSAVIRKFLRAVCSLHPVVLIMDDIHWADDASLALVEALLTDRECSRLVVVGSYRDDEVEKHGLSGWLRTMVGHEINGLVGSTTVNIGNLNVEDVAAILSDLLSVSDDDDAVEQGDEDNSVLPLLGEGGKPPPGPSSVCYLAMVVHRKTGGNPFHVVQFLLSLQDDGALTYCLGKMRWTWDVQAAEARPVTVNVAELLTAKMKQRLGADARWLLSAASCLGSSFDATTLALVAGSVRSWGNAATTTSEKGDDDVADLIDVCIAEGFLEQQWLDGAEDDAPDAEVTSMTYRFAHDQVSDSALCLVPEDDRPDLHRHVGRVLLGKLSEKELDSMIFVVVDLLNRGVSTEESNSEDKLTELAELNLRAGKRAADVSAFIAAESYLKQGMSLLPPLSARWAKPYRTLSLELHNSLAEAEFCNGHFDNMKKTVHAVLERDDLSLADKFRCHYALASCLKSINKLPEAMTLIRDVLSKMGAKLPKVGLKGAIVIDIVKTKKLLSGMSIDSFRDLPLVGSEERIMTMAMMDLLADCAYFIEPDLFPIVALKMLRHSIKHGISAYSTCGFAACSIILASVFKDYKSAYELGQFSLDVMKKTNARSLESKTLLFIHTFVNHWVCNQHLSLKPLRDGHRIGLMTGKVENAGFCINIYLNLSLNSGKALTIVEPDLARYIAEMEDYKQELVVVFMRISRQLCLSLMGRAVNPTAMDGDAIPYDEALKEATNRGNLCIHNTTKMYRMWAASYFGDHELAWRMYTECPTLEKRLLGTFVLCRVIFFKGLTALALARRSSGVARRGRWMRRAGVAISQVEGFIKKGNVNCVHMAHLFHAERASLRQASKKRASNGGGKGIAAFVAHGDNDEAKKHYESAISTAGRYGFLQDKALCCERAGEHFLSRGDTYWGTHHLSNAHRHYMEWGAQAKADQLRQKYVSLEIA